MLRHALGQDMKICLKVKACILAAAVINYNSAYFKIRNRPEVVRVFRA
jgi:hypothetical protein